MEVNMGEYDPQVYAIYHAIQELPTGAREKLWKLLEQAFPRVLDETDPAPVEVWDDPGNGFGKQGTRLLRFLCDRGMASERDVLKYLWPREWSAKPRIESVLRQRLRKLEQRMRRNLESLKSDWVLCRPRQRTLALGRYRD
jgi:hypothetical protein